MGLNFGAFAGGLAGGIKTGLEIADQRRKRELEEKELANKKAKEVKEQDATDYKNAVTTLESTREYKEKGRERRIEIMSSKDFTTPEARAEELRSFNQDYRQGLEALNIQTSQQMEGASETVLNKITPIANATLGNAETMPDYQKLTIGDKSIFVDDKSYEAAMENPNQYGIGKDGNLYALDQDGKITNQKVAEGKNFNGIVDDDKIGKTVKVIGADGKMDIMSQANYFKLKEEGKEPDLYEKKDSGVNITNVIGDGKGQGDYTYDEYVKRKEAGIFTGSYPAYLKAEEVIGKEQGKSIATSLAHTGQINALTDKLGVDNIFDIDIAKARKDNKTASLLDNTFRNIVKAANGSSGDAIIKEASTAINEAKKLNLAGDIYVQDLAKGKNPINVFNNFFDKALGSYIDTELTNKDKLLVNKYMASMLNVTRNELFGAVVPAQEQNNFSEAATALSKASPDVVRGISAMMKDKLDKVKTAKDILGTEAFYLKYGVADKNIQNQIKVLENALKGKSSNNGSNPFNKITKEKKVDKTKNLDDILGL